MTNKQYLQYVHNTNGGASVANFVEDYEPIGGMVWNELVSRGLAEERDGRIHLTPLGEEALRNAS